MLQVSDVRLFGQTIPTNKNDNNGKSVNRDFDCQKQMNVLKTLKYDYLPKKRIRNSWQIPSISFLYCGTEYSK